MNRRVERFDQIRPFFNALRTRRGDVAMIGDSQVLMSGAGHASGFQHTWGRKFRQYATGVHATKNTDQWVYDYAAGFGSSETNDALPSAFSTYAPSWVPGQYYSRTSGSFDGTGAFAALSQSHPNAALPMRWVFDYGTYASGGGTVDPVCRRGFTTDYVHTPNALNTTTGVLGNLDVSTLDVSEGVTDSNGALFSFQAVSPPTGGAAGTPPFVSFWNRVEWPDIAYGASVSVLLSQPGVPTSGAADAMAAITQAAFNPWLNMSVGRQQDRPILLVQIFQGLNDTTDGTASRGPNPAAGNTAAGVVDNHDAVIRSMRALWSGAGNDADDLYFLIGPYHPVATVAKWNRDLDDAFAAYVDANDRVAVGSRSRICTSALITQRGWDLDGGHLTLDGYFGFDDLAGNAVVPTPVVLISVTAAGNYDLRLTNESGEFWDDVAKSFTPWVDADVARYAIPGTRKGTLLLYEFAMPVEIARDVQLTGFVSIRAGGSSAVGDVNAGSVIVPIEYDGTGVLSLVAATDNVIDRVPGAVPTAAAVATATAAQIATDHGDGSYIRNTEPDNATIAASASSAASAATSAATAASQSTAANTNTSTLLTNLAALAAKYTGITSLANWLRAAWRSSTPDATALSEINTGGGSYDATTQSLQALRAKVDTLPGTSDVQVVISPILAQSSGGDPKAFVRVVSQYSAPTLTFQCVDANGSPVDLTGATLRFAIGSSDGFTTTPLFAINSPTITVTGSGNNIANVPLNTTITGTPRTLQAWLWKMLLAKGGLQIPAAIQAGP